MSLTGPNTPRSIAVTVGDALGVAVARLTRISGGDFAQAFRAELVDRRTIFVKSHHAPPPDFFSTEATGLRWLREAAAPAVPEVLAVSDGLVGPPFLALEWIEEGTVPPDEAAFGRTLAALHRAGLPCFGREDRRTTGSRALPNEPCESWAEFYSTQRLAPLRRLATDSGALSDRCLVMLDEVLDRIGDLGGPGEPPARLHGDLWAGNRLVDPRGRSWLIDPAAHGGHREFDLAMMRLFGGFAAAAFSAYHEAYPLADGWERRVPLHQLAPLIVHAIKFGGGYVDATQRALTAALA